MIEGRSEFTPIICVFCFQKKALQAMRVAKPESQASNTPPAKRRKYNHVLWQCHFTCITCPFLSAQISRFLIQMKPKMSLINYFSFNFYFQTDQMHCKFLFKFHEIMNWTDKFSNLKFKILVLFDLRLFQFAVKTFMYHIVKLAFILKEISWNSYTILMTIKDVK